MNLIFLAAGLGSRMGNLTQILPKALLPIARGRSILHVNLANRVASDLDGPVLVVGGHGWTALEAFCAGWPGPIPVQPVLNPDYASSGPIQSILTATRRLRGDEDLIIANGDTVYSSEIFSAVANSRPGAWLVVSDDDALEPDDMGVTLDEGGRVIRAAKSADLTRAGLVSAGLLCIRGVEARRRFDEAADSLRQSEAAAGVSWPWHEIVARLHLAGAAVEPLRVDRSLWREFDQKACLERYAAAQTSDHGQQMIG